MALLARREQKPEDIVFGHLRSAVDAHFAIHHVCVIQLNSCFVDYFSEVDIFAGKFGQFGFGFHR